MKVKSLIAKPKVVVIGGSFAGLCTIRHLKKYSDLDVTLIDPKDYFEYTPGVLHLLAGSNGDLISPLETITKDAAAVLQGKFIGINKNPEIKSINVQLLDSTGHATSISEIPYDAMIICSGVSYIAPIRTASTGHTLAQRLIEHEDYKLKLRNATRVIVAGGGLVGVELAAEISVRLEKQVKEVILISRTTLLNTLPERAGNFALKWFKTRKNVRLLLGDELSIENSPSSGLTGEKAGTMMSYKTLKGEVLEGDLYIDCTGAKPKSSNDKVIENTANDNFILPYNTNGLIAVDEHLMAINYPQSGIFAAGDVVEHVPGVGFASNTLKSGPFGRISNRPAVRNAHLAESQAEVCAANIAKYLSISPSSSGGRGYALGEGIGLNTGRAMGKYPQAVFGSKVVSPLLACVSLGPRYGIVIFNDLVVGGVLLGMLGAFVKYVIERSKLAEIRNEAWARAFWAVGHVVVNALHVLHVKVHNFCSFFTKKGKKDVVSAKVAFQ